MGYGRNMTNFRLHKIPKVGTLPGSQKPALPSRREIRHAMLEKTTERLRNGQLVRVDGSSGVVEILE